MEQEEIIYIITNIFIITNITHLSGNVCKLQPCRHNSVSDSIFGITSGNVPSLLRDTSNVCRCVS